MITELFWGALLLRVIAGAALLALAAAALEKLSRRAATERAVWRSALAVFGLFLGTELSGLNFRAFFPQPETARTQRRQIEARVETASSQPRAPAPPGAQTAPPQLPPRPKPLLWPALLWLGGTLAFLALRAVQSAACQVVQRRAARIEGGPIVEQVLALAGRLPVKRPVRLFASRHYATPVAFGIAAPAIGLPHDFEKAFSRREREVILAHELAHHAHHDPFWRAAADLVCALCWWNPLAWVMRRRFLHACELAADESSGRFGAGELLAHVLVAVAGRVRGGLASGWSEMAGEYRSGLAHRVTRLLQAETSMPRESAAMRVVATGFSAVILMVLQTISQGEVSPLRAVLESLQPLPAAQPSPKQVLEPVQPLAPKDIPTELKLAETPAQSPQPSSRPAEPSRSKDQSAPPPVESRPVLTDPAAAAPATAAAQPQTARKPAIKVETKWAEIKNFSEETLRELGIEMAPDKTSTNTIATAELIRMRPGLGWETNQLPDAPILGPVQSVLAPVDSETLVGELMQRPGVDLLTAPGVTTLSGQEAVISVTDIQTLVTGVGTNRNASRKEQLSYTTEQQPFGQTLRVVPTSLPDGTIHVEIEAAAREFLGYDDPGKEGRIQVWENGKKKKGKVPLPKMRERRFVTRAELKQGETLLLFAPLVTNQVLFREKVPVLGDIPGLGRLFRSQGQQIQTNQLLLLITARKL